jgi:branched-chain amino acid transport system substrate-binding protein
MAGIVAAALGQSTTGLDIATDWGDTRHSWSDPMEELGVPQSRFRAPWILVAAAGVLLTACGGGGGGGSSGNSAPVKVGYLVPLSGNFASNGKNEENGFELGLKDFGSTVNGHKIQVTYLDTQADPNIALSQARQLIDNQGIDMLEGPLAANEIAAVAAYAGPRGVPTDDLSMCAGIQLDDYVKFNSGLSSGWACNQPAIMAAKYAYEDLHWRKVATIGQDFAFGWLVVGGFADAFRAEGGQVVKMLWAPNTTTDFSPYVTQIPTIGVDGMYAEVSGAVAVRFTQAYHQFGLKDKLPLLGITQMTDYSALPSEDPAAITGLQTGAQYCDGIATPENQKFADEYKQQYGTYPGYYSDAGYAKARLLVEALKKVSNPSDHKALARALKSTPIRAARGPVKLSGPPAFSPIQNIYVCQVKSVNGELRNVPIKTYANVNPWGFLDQSKWEASFRKYSSERPTPG